MDTKSKDTKSQDMKWNRRDFARISALFGAAGAIAAPPPAAPAALAGHITCTAVADDCMRLAMCSAAVTETVKKAVAQYADLNRLGGLVQLPQERIPALLDNCRQRLASPKTERAGRQEMALIAGWLWWKAAESHLSGGDRVTRDIIVLREVSDDASPKAATVEDLNRLFRVLETRRLVALHTFNPDSTSADEWLSRLFVWHRDFKVLLNRYAEAYRAPAAEPAFYNRADPVIQLARAVQRGGIVNRAELEPALQAARSQSHYAQAIARGCRQMEAASAYLGGSIDSATLLSRIGA